MPYDANILRRAAQRLDRERRDLGQREIHALEDYRRRQAVAAAEKS